MNVEFLVWADLPRLQFGVALLDSGIIMSKVHHQYPLFEPIIDVTKLDQHLNVGLLSLIHHYGWRSRTPNGLHLSVSV